MTVSDDQVSGFRNSAPYINAHRGRTFVVLLPGDAIAKDEFQHIIHDLALLNSLGIRLVLVHGARPQISARLAASGIESQFVNHSRITDQAALEAVLESSGALRLKIEGLFSMGLANSPMFNAGLQLINGNFVIAKPVGIHDGKDYQYTGEVRRIQTDAIKQQLDGGNIVLLSPVGCSPTGELFNVNSEEVASSAAISLKADKLILMGEQDGIHDASGQLLRELSPQLAVQLLAQELDDNDSARQLAAACHAASNGVSRSHLVSYCQDGALLRELFTRDGCGTLVTLQNYESIRNAHIEDVGGILELIAPLEDAGALVRRSRERLENEIQRFSVIERDGMIVGCAALYPFNDNPESAEIACVAVHSDYRKQRRAGQLLDYLERRAKRLDIRHLFVLTTQAAHWFQEHGFTQVDVNDLPVERRSLYNFQRNSRVFCKTL